MKTLSTITLVLLAINVGITQKSPLDINWGPVFKDKIDIGLIRVTNDFDLKTNPYLIVNEAAMLFNCNQYIRVLNADLSIKKDELLVLKKEMKSKALYDITIWNNKIWAIYNQHYVREYKEYKVQELDKTNFTPVGAEILLKKVEVNEGNANNLLLLDKTQDGKFFSVKSTSISTDKIETNSFYFNEQWEIVNEERYEIGSPDYGKYQNNRRTSVREGDWEFGLFYGLKGGHSEAAPSDENVDIHAAYMINLKTREIQIFPINTNDLVTPLRFEAQKLAEDGKVYFALLMGLGHQSITHVVNIAFDTQTPSTDPIIMLNEIPRSFISEINPPKLQGEKRGSDPNLSALRNVRITRAGNSIYLTSQLEYSNGTTGNRTNSFGDIIIMEFKEGYQLVNTCHIPINQTEGVRTIRYNGYNAISNGKSLYIVYNDNIQNLNSLGRKRPKNMNFNSKAGTLVAQITGKTIDSKILMHDSKNVFLVEMTGIHDIKKGKYFIVASNGSKYKYGLLTIP